MNLMIFALVLIVLCFNTTYKVDDSLQFVDILPDFVGYLILWYTLEKRRINKRMKGLYTAVSVMTLLSFLFFLGQIKVFFAGLLDGDLIIISWLLDGLTYVMANYNGLVLLTAVLMLGWLLFAMLEYWERTDKHTLQCNVCKIGMALCALAGICHLVTVFFTGFPFSPNWISYPLSLLAVAAAWFVMKDYQEMLTGSHEVVEERRFGIKK